MYLKPIYLSLVLFSAISFQISYAQIQGTQAPQANFSNFKGKVYDIPFKNLKMGYGPHVYEYEVIGEIDWTEINIPERETTEDFPDVNKKSKFGMVLFSTMTIAYEGCYEFILNSDDGSLFWINDKLSVNNKGDHGMEIAKDTVFLKKGNYDTKVWYHQAYPDRYGIIFSNKLIGHKSKCSKDILPIAKSFSLNTSVLFDISSTELKPDALAEIQSVVLKIKNHTYSKITVLGHTDSQGAEDYNLKLSQKRADNIAALLRSKLEFENIIAIGQGEHAPLHSNETIEGRRKNRRVEIVIN